MPSSKGGTIHSFFQKRLSNTPEGTPSSHSSQISTPLGPATGNNLNKGHLATSATAPKKRKASIEPLDDRAERHTTPKHAKVSEEEVPDRKSKLQALLGEGNTQDNKLK
jgi:hypothetical protein